MTLSPLTLDDYLYWVEERHKIYNRRRDGLPYPWTEDPVLGNRKYCNVFRVLDKWSQYSIRELYSDPEATAEDMLFRSIFFRLTTRSEPWDIFDLQHGRYPLLEDLLDGRLDETWSNFVDSGGKFFSGGVYRVNVPRGAKGVRKHTYFLDTIREAFESDLFDRFDEVETATEKLRVLQTIPRIGPFLSQQILTDFGYTRYGKDFENDFVEIGPGSTRGLQRLGYGIKTPQESMRELQKIVQSELPDVYVELPSGNRRAPSVMDIQNTLCETDKYARLYNGEAKPINYTPLHGDKPLPDPVFPDSWN